MTVAKSVGQEERAEPPAVLNRAGSKRARVLQVFGIVISNTLRLSLLRCLSGCGNEALSRKDFEKPP